MHAGDLVPTGGAAITFEHLAPGTVKSDAIEPRPQDEHVFRDAFDIEHITKQAS